MTDPTESTRIPARSKRQVMDWSLVLLSQGIESSIAFEEPAGWWLVVAPEHVDRARAEIEQYRAENRHWPWRRRIPHQNVLFDWGCLAWAVLLGLCFWLQTGSAAFTDAGRMDAAAVSRGEWWRLVTAVFLHADAGHLAANLGIGFLLLGLTMGCYGTGPGLLVALLAGVGGNLAAWLVHPESHLSLGASGMVLGCVGLLAAQSISISRKNRQALKYVVSGLFGGVMLFVFLGSNPGSDLLAHLGGFVTGVILGSVLALAPRFTRNTAANVLSGAMFCALVILAWWRALGAGGTGPGN